MSVLVYDALIIAIVAAVAWALQKWLKEALRSGALKDKFSEVTLFANALQLSIWAVAALIIGENVFHIETQSVVTALGIMSLYLSLGLQDFVKNIVAGTQIVWGDVFRVGDHIVLGDHRGEVMDVNWRQTMIRDSNGASRAIPNTLFNSQVMIKRDGKLAHRYEMDLELRHGLDLDEVAADIERLANEVLEERGIKQDGMDVQVRFISSTYFGIKTSVRLFLKDVQDRTAGFDAVMRAISRTGYLASSDGDDAFVVKAAGDLAPEDNAA